MILQYTHARVHICLTKLVSDSLPNLYMLTTLSRKYPTSFLMQITLSIIFTLPRSQRRLKAISCHTKCYGMTFVPKSQLYPDLQPSLIVVCTVCLSYSAHPLIGCKTNYYGLIKCLVWQQTIDYSYYRCCK